MVRLVYSPEAYADLTEINDFGELHWGAERADAYTLDLMEAVARLADYPRIGRKAEHDRPGRLRRLLHRHHIIIYIYIDDDVHILRIVSGRSDVQRVLDDLLRSYDL